MKNGELLEAEEAKMGARIKERKQLGLQGDKKRREEEEKREREIIWVRLRRSFLDAECWWTVELGVSDSKVEEPRFRDADPFI